MVYLITITHPSQRERLLANGTFFALLLEETSNIVSRDSACSLMLICALPAIRCSIIGAKTLGICFLPFNCLGADLIFMLFVVTMPTKPDLLAMLCMEPPITLAFLLGVFTV